jgi:hypothetical protein
MMFAALYAIPYVGPFLAFATSRFGLPIVVAGAVMLFYEGVPLGPVRYIPYVGPALSGLVDGRVDREYAAGQLNERLAWQEKQRLRRHQARRPRSRRKQAEIDAAAQEYIDRQHSDAERIAELVRAQKDEDNAPPDPTKPAACKPPGNSAGVSTRIDAIGR